MTIKDLLIETIKRKASDLHITVGYPPLLRINGTLMKLNMENLSVDDTVNFTKEILNEDNLEKLVSNGEVDTSISFKDLGRFRVNIFKQRGSYGIVIRVIGIKIPTIDELKLPNILKELSLKQRGLILVTGPTGSGKSTTLASMIDFINRNRNCHILTLEDPIEYLHKHNNSIVNQREIGNDSKSYSSALRAALRQDPDVLLVGEMRDLETIQIALTAAETGHLVLSTLHTIGAAKTIDRIIDVFPPYQQQQIRIQLSTVLESVISQQLVPKSDGDGRTAAVEIMIGTSAIRNLIREAKTHQINSSIQTGAKYGMKTMDNSLLELYRNLEIDKETVMNYCVDYEYVLKYL